MTSESLLSQMYTGEELFHCHDRTFYAKGATVYVLNEDGSTIPFYTNGAGKIDALVIAEGVQYLFLAYTKLATSSIDVIGLETKTLIHTYQLPPDVTYISRMAISADNQVLAFITALPREVLYVMRLNHMNTALISAQLDLSSNRALLSFSADEVARPGSLSSSRLSSWIGLSFCPEGHALICISHRVSLLVTFHFTAQFCYLVARQVGLNLRSSKRALTAADFISSNYINSLDPQDIRGTGEFTDFSLSDHQVEPSSAEQYIVSQQYGGSGLPMGKKTSQKLSSPDGDWSVHSEDEVSTLLQNVYSQSVDTSDRLHHDPLELLPLVSTYCSLDHNASTNPTDFSAISISTTMYSHFYSIDKVLDDETDELEDYFLFPSGLRTTDPLAILTSLIKVHNFNLMDIRKVFHFTGSHAWIPKQSVCLIVCRNMGILAVVVPDFKYIYSSESRKAVTMGSFIFPPPPKTAFLITDYGTNDPAFDISTWVSAPDNLLGLGDGISNRYLSKYKTVPSLPLNSWYLGDRRLMSISSSVYLKADNQTIDTYSSNHDLTAPPEPGSNITVSPDGELPNEEAQDYKSHVLILCGFGDSTVKWFSLPLSAETASSNTGDIVAPICTYTYASLGPVRYMTMVHLTDRSVYYQKGNSFHNVVCLCLFSEVFAYLPAHVLLGNSRAASSRSLTDQQPVIDQDPRDEDDTSQQLDVRDYSIISPNKPAILCTIVSSLAYRGENLRATHFRSLINIKIMASLEVNRGALSHNAHRLIIYALSKYNSGVLIDCRNKHTARADNGSHRSIKPKTLKADLKEPSCSSNLFISVSDYVPLVTVCKPISPSPFACNTVRNSVAFLSFPMSALAPQKAEVLQKDQSTLQSGSLKVGKSLHCAYIGTLDCGRLYMLFADEQRRVYTHYFSCRIPMSIMDNTWTVPDPICSIISLQESKFVITGHASGYIRIFSSGFPRNRTNKDSYQSIG
ncbi:Hypothetical protein GLP15_1777, partial [Giardia lamblia P15]